MMWSEYLRMIFSFQPPRNSSSPSRRCRMTSVPRPPFSTISMEKSPSPGRFPADRLILGHAGAARNHGDLVGDDERGIEADAELADQVASLAWSPVSCREELARTGLGDGTEVGHGFPRGRGRCRCRRW